MSDLPRHPRTGQDPSAARHLRLVSDKPPRTPPQQHRRTSTFTPEEQARLRAALRHARALFGTWACLADALHMRDGSLEHVVRGRNRFTGDLAVRLARALGKPLESLYRAPTDAGSCPTCGARRAP